MAVERRPRQFLAVWNDAGDAVKGSTFEESLFVDGAFWKNELTSVAPENFGDFGTMFSNDLQQQYDSIVAEKATVDSECAALQDQVQSLESSVNSLTAKCSNVETELAMTKQLLATANSRISFLETELPFNPRLISADGFRSRLFKVLKPADLVRLYAVDADPMLEQIAKTFSEWPSSVGIRLDHENLLNPLGYLKSIDLLSDKDIEFLRADCTREEAFKE